MRLDKLLIFWFSVMVIIVLLMVFCSNANAKWTKKDTVYQITYSVFHVMDWGQTRNIAKNPIVDNGDGTYTIHRELNPILGKHPSVGEVDTYFIATLAGHTLISVLLPEKADLFGLKIKPRRYWQSVWIILEAGTVARNYGLGLEVEF